MRKCLGCSDEVHCCINGFAFVGINDAKKIRRFTGDYEFLDFSKLSKRVLKLLKDDDPCLEGTLRFSLVKNDNLLRIKKKNGKCFFLKNGKCKIYEVRPKICRIYPYWCIKLISGRIKVIEHDSNSSCTICNVNKITKDEEKNIKKIFNDILKEAEYYKKNMGNFLEYIKE